MSLDEKYTFALRKLALLGGLDDYIAVSSRELGDALEMSQQSASKRILELLDQGLIVRDLGARKQRIKITPSGSEALKQEYNEYRRIFELTDHITIHGTVKDGLGEGGYYIGQKGYHADTGIKICQLLESWGADAINATASGTDSRLSQSVEPISYPQGWRKHLAKAVKGSVSIPVLAAGGIVNEAMARASAYVGAEGAYAGTRFILSEECRAAQTVKEDILATGADDLIVLTEAGGYLKWRSTPHKVAKQAVAENQKGNLSPSTGSFYLGMFKGDLDAGINTVSSAASLIRSIDSCEDIVNELARGYDC